MMGGAVLETLLTGVLLVGVMWGAEARTARPGLGAELIISSSNEMHKPLFSNTAGPFTVGVDLSLTCSTQAPPSPQLSWWEEGVQLSAELQEGFGLSSATLRVGRLGLMDTGRRFTCREKGTELAKTIQLDVQKHPSARTEVLHVLVDGVALSGPDPIEVTTSEAATLRCVSLGYNPVAVSWWEGGTELESVATKSTSATSSLLSIKALTVDDSHRSFTCRSLNGQMSKTVTLNVNEDKEPNSLGAKDLEILFFAVTAVVIFVLVFKAVVEIRLRTKKSVGTNGASKMAAGQLGSRNRIIGAVRGKITGKESTSSLLINEEDFDDTSGEGIQTADAS